MTGATAVTRYDLRYSFDNGASWAVREDIWQSGSPKNDLHADRAGLGGGAHGAGARGQQRRYRAVVRKREGTPTVPALAAPAIASVTPSDASLGVVWTAPAAALPGEITAYDLRYILTSANEALDTNWTEVSGVWSSGPLHYLQTGLTNASGYDVQVRAVNGSADPPSTAPGPGRQRAHRRRLSTWRWPG